MTESSDTVTLEQAVAELPTTSADAVAQFLQDQGIVGRASVKDCPIARFLHMRTGFLTCVIVFTPHVPAVACQVGSITRPAGALDGITGTEVRLPEAVRSFVEQFDDGHYEHLREVITVY